MHAKRINGYDYFYMSVRRKGKITTVYLGQDLNKAKEKEKTLKARLKIGKIGRPHKFDRNPRFLHSVPGNGHVPPYPTIKREKRSRHVEKGQVRPLIIIPFIFILVMGSFFILTQADGTLTITIDSPLNQTYTTQYIDLNVTTNDSAEACLWNIDLGTNSSLSGSGTDWDGIISAREGLHNLNVYCNHSSGDWNLNNSIWFTKDTEPPYWTNSETNTQSTYSSTQESCLNITWQDSTSSLNHTYIQGNWSGSDQNYTASNFSSSQFYYCSIMPAGTFYWKSWANDTNGLLNGTDTWIFTVNQASNPIYLYLNGSQQNMTASYGETMNATAYISFGSVSLYRNGESVSTPDIQNLGAGIYVYLANSSGDSNHTSNSTVYNVTVSQISSVTTLLLNGSADNLTQTYGDSVNATASCDYGTPQLILNGTTVSSPYIESLAAGYYNFTANCSGDSNHSASSKQFFLTVNQATNPIYLYLNGSESNLTINYGETSNASAYVSYGSVNLYRDGESVSTSDIQNLGAGVYVYIANSTGDENHTANSTVLNVTVSKVASTTSLFLNSSQANLTQTYEDSVNASAYCDYGTPALYLNGSSVSNPYLDNLGSGYYNFTANCSGDSNHSASYQTYFLTMNKTSNTISLYLNGSQQNMTASYGETTNASAYVSFGSVNLYRNSEPVSSPDIQNLGADTYIYIANSSGDSNHTANSTYFGLTVNMIPSSTSLYLNSSQDNLTITYGETVNATAYCDFGTPYLQLNASNISNPYLDTLGAGYWNFTAYCPGDSNHSASEKAYFLTVNQAANPIYLYLNDSQSNLTITYGNTTNATAYVSFGTANLFRNGESVSTPDIQNLAAGTYVYVANTSGDSNHTSNSTVLNITVLQAASSTTIYLNGSPNDLEIIYGETVNASTATDFGSITFYLNGSSISNPYLDNLGAGYYNFTAYSSGDSNHSASSDTAFLTVNKISNPIFLYLNSSQQNLSVNYGETSNASAYVSFGSVNLYRNSEPVSTPDIQELGVGTYVYLANSSGDSNHTSNSTVYNVTVSQISSVTTLLLNGSADNLTQTYGDSVNATASCDYGTPQLILNGTTVSSPYIESLAAGYYNFTANCSGDSNHSVSGKTYFLTVQRATTYISLIIAPSGPTTYGTNITATCQVSNPEVAASLYRNGSLITENGSSVALAAATYNYTCNCSQTENYTAAENYTLHQINRASMPLSLYLNSSASNQSYSYGETINASGYKSYSEGSLTLYRNGTDYGNPEITNLPAGYWNYTLSFLQTENYSANSTTLFATVTSGGSVTTIYLNGSSSDLEITYGETVNASAYTNFGSITFQLNGTNISNPYLDNLAAGYYNFTAYSTGDANHSGSEDTAFLTVNQVPNPIFLYLNGSQSNQTINYGETSNATAYVSYGSVNLYRNEQSVSSPDIQNLGAGVYVYLANSSGDSNHTSNSTTFNITVGKIPSSTTLLLNGSQDNLTQTYGDSVNATAYCDFGTPYLQLNASNISNPYVGILGGGYWNLTAYCPGDSNHSSSEKIFFLTVNQTSNPIYLYLNDSQSNQTITYGETANASAYVSFGTVSLFRNYSSVSNPELADLAAGSYIYIANSTGDSNHTANSTYLGLEVNRATAYITLDITPSSPTVYGTPITPVCQINTSEPSATLYMNGSAISNDTAYTLAAGTYNFTCNSSQTENYTAAENYTFHEITRAPMPLSLSLNSSQSDQSYTYGETTNASGYKSYSEGSLALYRNGTDVGNPEIANLPAGYWNYTLTFNQTQNYSASSTALFATVNKASNPIYLYLNGTQANLSVFYNNITNASAYVSFGTVELYRNDTQVSNPEITCLAVGYYLYKANSSGDSNHTANSTYFGFTVNTIPSTTSLFLNGSQDNLTQTYGETVNATAYCDHDTVNISLNGTAISNPYTESLAAGYYNFIANCSGDSNHSATSKQFFLTVNKAPNPIYLYLNGSQSNLTASYGDTTNASAYASYGSVNLYKDGESISNPDIQNLEIGVYVYLANTSGDSNHTANSTVYNITVAGISVTTLLLNGSQANMNQTYGQSVNVTASCNYGNVTLQMNGSNVSNPFQAVLGANYYNFTAYCSGDSNHTASEKTYFVTVNIAFTYASLIISPSTPTAYGTPITATCYMSNSEVEANLYRNSSLITENGISVTLAAATYNYTCNCSATGNYTGAQSSAIHHVNRAPMPLSLFLNSSQSNITQTYGETTNASGYKSYSEGSLTLYRNGTDVGNPEIANLPAGDWNYTLAFVQTENYSSNSTTRFATVSKAPNPIYLYLNGTQAGLSVSYGNLTNASAYVSFGTAELYRNYIQVSNPEIAVLGAGYYLYKANSSGDSNHTSNSTSFSLTVNKIPSIVSLYLNGSQDNLTQTYGDSVNASAYCDFGIPYIQLNASNISNPYVGILGGGYWNLTSNCSGDSNHSSSEKIFFLTVDKIATNITLLINGTDGDFQSERLSSINFTIYLNHSQTSTVYIYQNGTLLASGTAPLQNISTYPNTGTYNISANYSGQNYTSAETYHILNIVDTTPPDLWFISPSSNGSTSSNNWILVNVSASENLSACLLDWNNGTWTNVSMNVTGDNCFISMTGLSQGYYYFRVYGNDSAGNLNMTEDRQARYYVAPSQPSGGNQNYGGGGYVVQPPANATQASQEPPVKTNPIHLEISPGEKNTTGIRLKNTLNTTQTFSGKITGNITSLLLNRTFTFTLRPGEEREISIQVDVVEGMAFGTYSGEVQIISGSERYSIPMTVRVVSAPMAIGIASTKAETAPGDIAQFYVTFHNTGYAKSVRLVLELLGPEGVVIATSEEMLDVGDIPAAGSIMIPSYVTEGTYTIKATASYIDSDNNTISALATDSITVGKRFGWWTMELVSWINVTYLAIAAMFTAILLVLAIRLKHRKDFEVKVVRIKKEDIELTKQVARFLRKYSRIPRPKKEGKPWKIPEKSAGEEQPPKKEPKRAAPSGKKSKPEQKKHAAKKHKAPRPEQISDGRRPQTEGVHDAFKPSTPSVQKEPKSSVEMLMERMSKSKASAPVQKKPFRAPIIHQTVRKEEPKPISDGRRLKTEGVHDAFKPSTPSGQEAKPREETDKDMVKSLRSEIEYIQSNLEALAGKGKDISSLKKDADRLRRTLNLGESLGHETLAKTRKKVDRLKNEYQALASE